MWVGHLVQSKVVESLVSCSNTCNLYSPCKMDSPGPEHKTIEHCYPKLVSCLQQSPDDVVIQLRPLGIFAPTTLEFLENPHNGNIKKVQKIIEVVKIQMKTDANVFHEFVEALKAAGPWTKRIISELEKTYSSFRTPFQSHGKL